MSERWQEESARGIAPTPNSNCSSETEDSLNGQENSSSSSNSFGPVDEEMIENEMNGRPLKKRKIHTPQSSFALPVKTSPQVDESTNVNPADSNERPHIKGRKNKNYFNPTKEQLLQYIGVPAKSVGDLFNISSTKVNYLRKKYDIPRRTSQAVVMNNPTKVQIAQPKQICIPAVPVSVEPITTPNMMMMHQGPALMGLSRDFDDFCTSELPIASHLDIIDNSDQRIVLPTFQQFCSSESFRFLSKVPHYWV